MTTKVVIAALILMIAVIQTKASEVGPSLTVSHENGSSVFLVKYWGSQTGDVKMTIKDNKGRVLIKKSIKRVKDFLLPVNLAAVGEGVYTIEVDNSMNKQIQTIDYSNQTPATYTHVLPLGDNRYMLSVASTGTKKIHIQILDDAQDFVFEQGQLIEGSFVQVYELKNFVGSPTFVVTDPSGYSLIIE
jgi:hypothetical protein